MIETNAWIACNMDRFRFEEKDRIMYVFDMFTQLFSIALLDVISGLSVHESSTQIRHIIRYLSTAMNLCHFDADDDCDDDEIRKPMKHWQWHQTMWCSNQPHDQFILHCELQARTILCICMLQQHANGKLHFVFFPIKLI